MLKPGLFTATGLAASFLALFFMLGGHWLALQSVAWTRMLAEFSRTDSLREAVGRTFDGKHPCRMCLSIRDGRQQEERAQQKSPLLKTQRLPELFCDSRPVVVPVAPMSGEDAVAFVPRWHADFVESPPSPPPRKFTAVL